MLKFALCPDGPGLCTMLHIPFRRNVVQKSATQCGAARGGGMRCNWKVSEPRSTHSALILVQIQGKWVEPGAGRFCVFLSIEKSHGPKRRCLCVRFRFIFSQSLSLIVPFSLESCHTVFDLKRCHHVFLLFLLDKSKRVQGTLYTPI